jgi:RecB family exonuclease
VTRLPELLTRCRVPATFSPSQLAFGEHCLLRAVFGSTRDLPTLTAHPAAALGQVFHRLLEMAVRGEVLRSDTPGDDAERALDVLLDEADCRLAASWPSDPPRLRQVLPPLTWRRKRRVVLDLVEKYLSGAVPRGTVNTSSSTLNAKDLRRDGRWSEVQMDAVSLRLRGRADQIQRTGSHVVIRDLKTGRVLTTDGEVLPQIERQLRLYGTMAHVVWPSAIVSLVVDDGVEREVSFQPEHEAETLGWLEGVLARLPPDADIESDSLANPGSACEGCAYRHVCSAYRREAPISWRSDGPVRMPLDTWGQIVAIAVRSNQLADVTIRDAAGRTIKVFGLAAFRVAEARPGDTIWLFGLRTQDKRGGPTSWQHPRNFFEIADETSTRAWTVQSYTGAP